MTFTLDTSVLAGAQYTTKWVSMDGDFRDVQFRWTQTVAGQDMEVHYCEFHFDVSGVSEE